MAQHFSQWKSPNTGGFYSWLCAGHRGWQPAPYVEKGTKGGQKNSARVWQQFSQQSPPTSNIVSFDFRLNAVSAKHCQVCVSARRTWTRVHAGWKPQWVTSRFHIFCSALRHMALDPDLSWPPDPGSPPQTQTSPGGPTLTSDLPTQWFQTERSTPLHFTTKLGTF